MPSCIWHHSTLIPYDFLCQEENGFKIFPSWFKMSVELSCQKHGFDILGQHVEINPWLCSKSKMDYNYRSVACGTIGFGPK